MKNNRFNQGNALAEYVLPLALIASVGLFTWQQLFTNYGDQLQNVFTQPVTPSFIAANSGGNAATGSGSTGGSSSTIPLTGGTTTGFTGSTSAPLETAGSNGSAQEVQGAATALDTLASTLSAKPPGTVDPKLIDIITRLANKGHDIGNLITANGSDTAFFSAQNTLQSTYAEFVNYSGQHSLNMTNSDVTDTVLDHFLTIAVNTGAAVSVAANQAGGGAATHYTGSSTTVHTSSNIICTQSGSGPKTCIQTTGP